MATIKNAQGDSVTVQRNGTKIEGVVTDRNGLVVKGAKVVITNARSQDQATATTGKLGDYSAEAGAQKNDKIIVHVEYQAGNPKQTVVISGVVTLKKKEAAGAEEFELAEDKEALSLIAAFNKEIAAAVAQFDAAEKGAKAKQKEAEFA